MDEQLRALRASATRLTDLITPLDEDTLSGPSYADEWTVAQVLSHVGSGAVIMARRVDDTLAGEPTPDEFAPTVWDEWDAKSPRQMADGALAADDALVSRLEGLSAEERADLRISFGPMELDAAAFVALRLNEHTLHSWDVAVALDPTATLPADATAVVIDNLAMIAGFTARPTGAERTITIGTTGPERSFAVTLTPDTATFATSDSGAADLVLPAEAFARLVYGRLDPDHTPSVEGDSELLETLRQVFPGP